MMMMMKMNEDSVLNDTYTGRGSAASVGADPAAGVQKLAKNQTHAFHSSRYKIVLCVLFYTPGGTSDGQV